ncbi:LysM peptidoglycan-binding domain-containing protein [uncultured Alsobacter sp.]|uniref:LysM peptidoglycan-binding domain-containing protein n=1 Tax=uncultured Alsobacter sp. TaxID=1748258 RepID=UPI0025EFDF7C|nr:LysM peptidoglycan-binding domain-containing protein [uncultured Alsobacter sp.]
MADIVTAAVNTVITVTGGTLFAIAAQYLGDATQWNRIARLNGLTDPFLTGTVTLRIPPANANAGNGGILFQ